MLPILNASACNMLRCDLIITCVLWWYIDCSIMLHNWTICTRFILGIANPFVMDAIWYFWCKRISIGNARQFVRILSVHIQSSWWRGPVSKLTSSIICLASSFRERGIVVRSSDLNDSICVRTSHWNKILFKEFVILLNCIIGTFELVSTCQLVLRSISVQRSMSWFYYK